MSGSYAIARWALLRAILSAAAAILLIAVCGCPTPPSTVPKAAPPAAKPLLVDIATQAGVLFHHTTGKGPAANIEETTGSGCAVFDYDNDGWLDIFLVGGKSPPGDGNHLYHNNHDGTFTDVSAKAGVAGLGHGFGMGVAVGDYDGDGYLDLYVTYHGKNILFHNEGNGTFKDVTDQAGVGGGGFCTAAAFADLDGDGKPDLYVARYVQFDSKSKQLCYTHGFPASCPPYFYPPEPDLVYKNLGNGKFRRVEKEWGLIDNLGRGMGVATVDYDRDGKIDLFVANDGTANYLFRNKGRGHFESVAAVTGISTTETGNSVANMGCDFGDIMGDGNFGCITGVFEDEEMPMWRYQPPTGFVYMTRQTGLSAITRPMLTFGIGFADLDNDGLQDIFLVNGHVEDKIADIRKGSTYAQPRAYFHNQGGGKFEDWSARGGPAVTTPAVGRGLAFGDLFNDGGMAMVVNNADAQASVLRNDHPRQNWVELRLISKGPAWEAIGAIAELKTPTRTLLRFVHTSYSYASGNDPRLHFGLGKETQVSKITILWPGGHKTEHPGVKINRLTTIVEPGATPPAPVRKLIQASE